VVQVLAVRDEPTGRPVSRAPLWVTLSMTAAARHPLAVQDTSYHTEPQRSVKVRCVTRGYSQ